MLYANFQSCPLTNLSSICFSTKHDLRLWDCSPILYRRSHACTIYLLLNAASSSRKPASSQSKHWHGNNIHIGCWPQYVAETILHLHIPNKWIQLVFDPATWVQLYESFFASQLDVWFNPSLSCCFWPPLLACLMVNS